MSSKNLFSFCSIFYQFSVKRRCKHDQLAKTNDPKHHPFDMMVHECLIVDKSLLQVSYLGRNRCRSRLVLRKRKRTGQWQSTSLAQIDNECRWLPFRGMIRDAQRAGWGIEEKIPARSTLLPWFGCEWKSPIPTFGVIGGNRASVAELAGPIVNRNAAQCSPSYQSMHCPSNESFVQKLIKM